MSDAVPSIACVVSSSRTGMRRGLKPDAIEARIHDGVLELFIPKPEELKPRRIPVREEESTQTIEGTASEPRSEGQTDTQQPEGAQPRQTEGSPA